MDSVTFKPGDRVINLTASGCGLEWGKEYTAGPLTDGRNVHIEEGDDTWLSMNFKLAPADTSVRNTQIGGAHYHEMKIQPYEYSLANNLGPLEHTAIKYVSRWRKKNGVEDLKKAIHTIQYLIEYTEKNGVPE